MTIKDEPVDLISHHQQQSTDADSGGGGGSYFNGHHQYHHPHANSYYPSSSFHHPAAESYQRTRDCIYQQQQTGNHHKNPISPSPSPNGNPLNYATGFGHPPAYSYGPAHHHQQQQQPPPPAPPPLIALGSHHHLAASRFAVHQFHRHQRVSVSTPPSSPQVIPSEMLNAHHPLIHQQQPPLQHLQPNAAAGLPLPTTAAGQPTGQPGKVKRG